MGLSGAEQKALAWLLLNSPAERKRLAVSTARCRRGCVLGTVFGFEGSLLLWTVYDFGSEADTLAFYRLGESMREARTAPQPRAEDLAALTAAEYMTAFRAGPSTSPTSRRSATASAWLPSRRWQPLTRRRSDVRT